MIKLENFNDSVEFISANNCPTNIKLCNDAGVKMKGCDSHKLHLAVVEMTGPEEKRNRSGGISQVASPMQAVISKVDQCMKELGTYKNSAILRTKTRLRPERRIKIRWSSLFSMLKKWLRIKQSVASATDWPVEFLDQVPTAIENRMIEEHLSKLRNFESVSKKLQSSGDKRLNVYQSRALLDNLIKDYGEEYPLTAIKPDAKIIQNKHFEIGI